MSSEVAKRRRIIKYKCPFCDIKFERAPLITHVSNKHEDELPEGFSPLRYVFHYVNKKPLTYHGICTECKGPTAWDENKGRYNRQCEKKACHDRYVAKFEENMRRKRGVTRISATAEGQEKMLANRKISGKYKWSDGTEKTYTGKYELHALEFMDKVMHLDSKDVFCPGPVLEYMYEGKKHLYITDFYYQPYDLIIEVKDGGKNPNKRSMPEYRAKQIAKEKYIIDETDFNYIRLTNDSLDQLLAVFMDLKMQLVDDTKDRVVHVNESVIVEASLGSFKKVKIDEELVKSDSHFKHLRTENCTGYAYYDNDKLVGYINTEDKDGEVWIQALEVMPEYRKTGIGKKLLDFAVKNLKANYLSVNKKNAIAIRMYKNYGFEVYKETDTMYFMSYKKAVEESVVFNEKDILYNKEAFENGDINLCFITGLSGSGKSTMAIEQEKENVDVSNMDFLQTPGDTFKNIEDMKKNCEYCSELIYQFFKGPGKKYFVSVEDIKDIPGTEYEDKVFVEFVDFAKKYAKSHKNKKFICEGIYFFLNKSDNSGEMVFKPQWFDDYAFYIKGTSALISKFRGAKRDSQDNWNKLKPNGDDKKAKGLKRVANFFRDFFRKNSWKWYMCDEKNLNVFRDYFKNKPETVLEKYDSVNEAGLFNFKKKEIDQLNQDITDKINSSKYPWFFIHIQTQGKDSVVELYGFEKDPKTNSSKDSKGIFSAGVKYKMLLEKKFKNFYFSKNDLDSKLKKFAKSNCGAAKKENTVMEHMNALLTGFVPGIDSKGSVMVAAPNMQNTVFAGTSCNDDDFWIVKNNKFDEIIHRNEAGVLVRESVPESKHPDLMNLYKVNNADYDKISKTICENLGKEVSNTFLYETVFGHKCGNAFDVVFEDVSEVLSEDTIEKCIKEAVRNDILGTGIEFPAYKEDKLGIAEHAVYLDEWESVSYNGIKFNRIYHITKEDYTYKFLKLLAEGNVDG